MMKYLIFTSLVSTLYTLCNSVQTSWLSNSPLEMIELYEKYSGTDSLPRSRNLKTCNVLAYVTPWNSKGLIMYKLIFRL